MSIKHFLFVFLVLALLFPIHACKDTEAEQQKSVFKQVPEIQAIKPRKPVKIKLRRSAKGGYSWDISGDNADEIIRVDRKLKEGLEAGTLNPGH